jgi:hypothetical protein
MLAFGAVLLIAASVGLFWFAVSGKGRKEQAPPPVPVVEAPATTTSDLIPRALDGILVPPTEAQLQSYAVMVENHTDARPLSSPAMANLVYEIPVEGGITRYMLVFDATTTVDVIGPVRSARPYFVDFADGLNAVYAHVGGSPEALDKIKSMTSFRDLNEFWNGKFFWRSAKRVAPHNAYTRTDLLHEADASKQWAVGHFRSWSYKDDDPLTSTGTQRGDAGGPRLIYGGAYSAGWKYDKQNDQYIRSEAGEVQKDQSGTVVMAKNVVVIMTDASVLDSYGRLKLRTTGRGKAFLYRDGKKLELSWQRNAGEHIRFESVDGAEAVFNRGTTWIEVMTDPAAFKAIDPSSGPLSATSTAAAATSTGTH